MNNSQLGLDCTVSGLSTIMCMNNSVDLGKLDAISGKSYRVLSSSLSFPLFTVKFMWNGFYFSKEWFIGHELWDDDATIVHHFAFHQDPSAFKYPLLDAGFLLSAVLLKRFYLSPLLR